LARRRARGWSSREVESDHTARLFGTEAAALAAVVVTCLLVHSAVVGHAFLNWDDPDALVRNEPLDRPGVTTWAFSTTHMSHYQPLSWLAWAALRRAFGTTARVHHVANLVGHALVAGLVFLLALAIHRRRAAGARRAQVGAAVAALLFALHPLRVEVVAWASALPYVLALGLGLLSLLAYLRHAEGGDRAWLWIAVGGYAVSLLSRPIALGYPAALVAVALATGRRTRTALLETLPFAALALAAATAETQARAFVGFDRVGIGPRLTSALTVPFVYLGRELVPLELSPLDVLPLEARTSWPAAALGLTLLAASAVPCFRFASRAPWAVAAWASYLALLVPALGLTPSGLQATADRYTYLPDVALALAAGGAFAGAWSRRPRGMVAGGVALAVLLAVLSARQASWWRDSVTLWTRAVALDPRNDVALYNLALARDEAGDEAGALRALRETLALVPEHGPARRTLEAIETRQLARDAAAAADAGRLEEAIGLYTRVLERAPDAMRARASRGMALVQKGRLSEAAEDLAAARRLGNDEAAVASALALCLNELGQTRESRDVLESALRQHQGDLGLRHNLARLLVMSADTSVRDAQRALDLSLSVLEATQGLDPRVFDTLASVHELLGHPERAREAALRGAAIAEGAGDAALAATLRARAGGTERKSPGRLGPGARERGTAARTRSGTSLPP